MEQKIVKITTATLNGLRPGRARLLRDEQCPNLLVAVSKRAVTWKFKAERRDPSKPKGWATQSATLGPVEDHTPERARAWAYGLLSKTKAGVNPNASTARPSATGWTLRDLWAEYARDLVKRGKNPYNHHHYGKHLTDLWDKPIKELTRDDVKALHASITAVGLTGAPAPTSANRVRECLSAALNFALEEGKVDVNVAFASRRLRNPENKRNNAFPLDGLPFFWTEVAKLSPIRTAFHSVVFLLGLRLETAMVLRWDWINLDDASLVIPEEAMKMSNELWLPLSREVVAILRGLPRVSPYVFAVRTRDRTRWTHIGEAKEKGPLRYYVAGVLRTTYRTAHRAIRTPDAIAEYLHGHVTKGIAAHYIDQTAMRDDFRKAQQAVADFLTAASLPSSARSVTTSENAYTHQ